MLAALILFFVGVSVFYLLMFNKLNYTHSNVTKTRFWVSIVSLLLLAYVATAIVVNFILGLPASDNINLISALVIIFIFASILAIFTYRSNRQYAREFLDGKGHADQIFHLFSLLGTLLTVITVLIGGLPLVIYQTTAVSVSALPSTPGTVVNTLNEEFLVKLLAEMTIVLAMAGFSYVVSNMFKSNRS